MFEFFDFPKMVVFGTFLEANLNKPSFLNLLRILHQKTKILPLLSQVFQNFLSCMVNEKLLFELETSIFCIQNIFLIDTILSQNTFNQLRIFLHMIFQKL